MVSSAGPFLVLRWARCIDTWTMLWGVVASLTAHIGLVTVLGELNGHPLQGFVVLLMGACLYIIGMWIFLLGQRAGYWSDPARKAWRAAGKFFGGFLLAALILSIATFHAEQWQAKRELQRQQQRSPAPTQTPASPPTLPR
jgi:hypothetical protein